MDGIEAVLDDLVAFAKQENLLEVIEEEEKELRFYRQAEQPTTADEADEAESPGGTDAARSPPDRRQESASSGGTDAAHEPPWRQHPFWPYVCEGSGGADAGPRNILPPPPPPLKKSKKEADAADEPQDRRQELHRRREGSGGADARPGNCFCTPPPPPKKSKKDDGAGEDDAASWSPGWCEGSSDWSSDWWNCRAQSSGSSDGWKGKGYSRNNVWRNPHRQRGGTCPRWQAAKHKARQMDSQGGVLYFQQFMLKYKRPTSAEEDAATRFDEPYLQ